MEKIVIIGAGPAGISAALYAVRGGGDPLVLYHGAGALEKAEKIENFYGLEQPLTGKQLCERGREQARALGVRMRETQVLGMRYTGNFLIRTTEGEIEAECVILATGSKRSVPPIPGVKELEGRGVSYCAVCDAFFYRGRNVAVLGNSDFALHEAEELSNTAASVTIFTDGKEPEFSREHTIPVNTMRIQAIEGEEAVEGLLLAPEVSIQENREDAREFVPTDGVFVALGVAGSTEIAKQMGAQLSEKGRILVDTEMATTIPGLFAAGDCTGGLLQISKAVYEGSQAGLSAVKYLRQRHKKSREIPGV